MPLSPIPSLMQPLLVGIGVLYLLASIVCFVAYARDKSAARRGARRTPERRLLLLGLAGGWPGAVLAQRWLRHKTAKPAFLWRFRCSVAANLALLAALAWCLLRFPIN